MPVRFMGFIFRLRNILPHWLAFHVDHFCFLEKSRFLFFCFYLRRIWKWVIRHRWHKRNAYTAHDHIFRPVPKRKVHIFHTCVRNYELRAWLIIICLLLLCKNTRSQTYSAGAVQRGRRKKNESEHTYVIG